MKGDSSADAQDHAIVCANALRQRVWDEEKRWREGAWDHIFHAVRYESWYVSDCSVGAACAFEFLVGIGVAYLRNEYIRSLHRADREKMREVIGQANDLRFYVNYASVGLWARFNTLHFSDDERALLVDAAERFRNLLSVLAKHVPDTS